MDVFGRVRDDSEGPEKDVLMNTLIGIQARSRSTRFPRKVFQDLWGKPVLLRVYEACLEAFTPGTDIAILGPYDDHELKDFCDRFMLYYLAPKVPENDLISRYKKASVGYEGIVRVTADCPLLPPRIIRQALDELERHDYVCNTIWRTYPDGYDIQACSRSFLDWVDRNQPNHREHPFYDFDNNLILREETTWKVKQLFDETNRSRLKISVDTKEDLERCRDWYEKKRNLKAVD
jgi:spore coat polysaccharide biosynthesis protein SpsF